MCSLLPYGTGIGLVHFLNVSVHSIQKNKNKKIFNLLTKIQTEWSAILACPSLLCFFIFIFLIRVVLKGLTLQIYRPMSDVCVRMFCLYIVYGLIVLNF